MPTIENIHTRERRSVDEVVLPFFVGDPPGEDATKEWRLADEPELSAAPAPADSGDAPATTPPARRRGRQTEE